MTQPAGRPLPDPPPPADGHSLHPLSLERIVALTVGMLRFRWRVLFGAAVLPLLPAHLVVAVIQVPYVQAMNRWALEMQEQFPLQPAMVRLPAGWAEAVVVLIGLSVLLALVGLVATAAVTQAAGDIYAGRETSAVAALGRALRRLPSVIGAHLLYFVGLLGIFMGGLALSIAFFIGGPGGGVMPFLGLVVLVGTVAAAIFVVVRWALVMPALMIDDKGAIAALGRSWRIVAGSSWRVLGYVLLVALVAGILGAVLVQIVLVLLAGASGGIPTDGGTVLAQTLLAGAITTVLTPIAPVAMTLLYFDIRWRRGEMPTT